MPGRSGEAWNEEDMQILRRMYRDGSTNREIASALNRTEASIQNRVSRMKRRRLLGLSNPDVI